MLNSASAAQPKHAVTAVRKRCEDPLYRDLKAMHEGLPSHVEVELSKGLRFLQMQPQNDNRRASTCTGTHIAEKALEKLASIWVDRYNIGYPFTYPVHCEKDPAKRKVIYSQFNVEFMSTDMANLDSDVAPNDVHHGKDQLVPVFHALDTGFPCTSRTPQSSACSRNLHCVQHGSGATALGFGMVAALHAKHNPLEASSD